jgi:cell division protein FtsZ
MARGDWRGVKIKVVGVGGAGGNAVDRMIQMGIPGVDFVAANSDLQALARSEAPCKVQLGASLTRSLGAGGDPHVGAGAAEESRERLGDVVREADMVFIAAGLGGGTGTGAAPVVARLARAEGALTIAVVTMPFSFEGNRRRSVAEDGAARLEREVDALIVVPNDRLLRIVGRRMSLDIAFRIADEVLRQGVQGISELVTRPGLINLDFADVRSIVGGAGRALMAIGYAEGKERAPDAARMALESPLLNVDAVSGVERILVNITGGEDLTLAEVSQAMQIISETARPQAEVLFGAVIDPKMLGRVQITLIGTGLSVEKKTVTAPQPQRHSLAEILGDELAVPAFMRSPRRVRVEGWRVA